jgi:hypothetical protein
MRFCFSTRLSGAAELIAKAAVTLENLPMPMIETMTMRFPPAAAPARCRFRAEAVKNAVDSSWSSEGPVAGSMIVSAPTSASSSPRR